MQQQIELKPISIEDYTQLLSTMKAAYTNWQGSYWSESSIQKLLDIFPQGQIGVYVNDTIVGCALSIIVHSRFNC